MIADFFEPFVTAPSPQTGLTLLTSLHDLEAEQDGPDVQRIPYFRYEHKLDATLKETARKLLANLSADHPDCLTAQTVAIGVTMRLNSGKSVDVEPLTKLMRAKIEACTDTITLFELGNIYRALPHWRGLNMAARAAIQQLPNKDWKAHIACDWLLLANYRMLLKKYEANTMNRADVDALEAVVETCAGAIGENTKNVTFYRSVIASLRANLRQSFQLLLKAQKLPGKLIILFERLELFSEPDALIAQPSKVIGGYSQNLIHHIKHGAEGKCVLLVSLDKLYFERYAETLLASFGHWNAGGVIHLHCIGFRPEAEKCQALEQTTKVKINFTEDRFPDFLRAKHLFNGYCASARYLYLPHYMKLYGKVAVSDVDGVILRPLDSLWEESEDTIMLAGRMVGKKRSVSRLLWEAIAAGSMAIKNTPENLAFAWRVANALAGHIDHCRSKSTKLFYADQIALMMAYLASMDSCQFATIGGLFSQKGGWSIDGDASKTDFQKAVDYTKPPVLKH